MKHKNRILLCFSVFWYKYKQNTDTGWNDLLRLNYLRVFFSCRAVRWASQSSSVTCDFTTAAPKCLHLGRGRSWPCGLDSSSVSLSSSFMLLLDTGTFDSTVSTKLSLTRTLSSPTRAIYWFYIQGGAKRTHVFYICLWFLSLGLPQIKSLRPKTSYSRRSESFHSRRNCNCATRNVSKCDAELWGEALDVCTARRTPSFRYNFP